MWARSFDGGLKPVRLPFSRTRAKAEFGRLGTPPADYLSCRSFLVAIDRINASQHFFEVIANRGVAAAGSRLQFRSARDEDPAAPRLQDAALLQSAHDPADVASADAKQAAQLLLSQQRLLAASAVE